MMLLINNVNQLTATDKSLPYNLLCNNILYLYSIFQKQFYKLHQDRKKKYSTNYELN